MTTEQTKPKPAPKTARKGVVSLKEPGKVAVRLRITGGAMTADQLAAVADIARRYSGGEVHLTLRQGVEIAPVDADAAEDVCAELEAHGLSTSALGATVRGLVACPGIACRNGIVDGQALARRIDESFREFTGLHAKFKIALAGCPNACSKPSENDLGIMGVAHVSVDADPCTGCGACEKRCKVAAIAVADDSIARLDTSRCIECGGCALVCPTGAAHIEETGYRVLAGGKMGRFPKLGDVIAPWLADEEQVVGAVGKVLEWYRTEGKKGERIADTMARIGPPDLS